MNLEITSSPSKEDIEEIRQGLRQYNRQHREVREDKPLAIFIKDDSGKKVAGVTALTFGDWLEIEYLWVSDHVRGQGLGSRLMENIEAVAIKRGCKYSLLDTFGFQARPFYEKHGYKVGLELKNYPKTGHRYYMTKELNKNNL